MKFTTKLFSLICITVAALGCGGCAANLSHEPTIWYHADTAFTEPERQCIQASADQWREQTSGLANAEVVYDYNPRSVESVLHHKLADKLVRWTSQTPELVEFEKEYEEENGEKFTLLGQTKNHVTDTIRTPIEVRLVADRFPNQHICKLTTIHEFGHAFGLGHTGKPTEIMYPSVIGARSACLKKDELMLFAWNTSQPFELMKPCPDDPPELFEPKADTTEDDVLGSL